jgi:hypothetical protein
MKKILTVILISFVIAANSGATMVVNWNFNQETGSGALLDATSPATDVAATGSVPFVLSGAGQPGHELGQAADLLTSSQYFQTTTHSELDFGTGDFTISGWLRAPQTTYASDQGFIIQNAGSTTTGYYLFLGKPSASYKNKLNFQVKGGTSPMISSDAVIADDQWHWFAVVAKSSTMTMYVDGVLQAATASYGAGTSATSPAGTAYRIGRFYDGYLDEMQAYDAALNLDAVYAEDGKTLTSGSLYELWQVPEPATICMLGFGLLTLIRKK